MAIPDNYTYSLSEVYDELQFSGAPYASASLSNMFADAPQGGYCSAYSGTTSCLRNYRGYELMPSFSGTTNGGFNRSVYDHVNKYTYLTHGAPIGFQCLDKINDENYATVSAITMSAGEIIFDGNNHLWYAGAGNKNVGKFNVTTGVDSVYTGFVGCPQALAFDGTDVWSADICTTGDGRFSKITSGGTVTSRSCNLLCQVGGIAFDGNDIWVTSRGNDSVGKINTSTCAVTVYSLTSVGCQPTKMTFDGTYLWTVNTGCDTFSRISTSGVVTNFTGTTGVVGYGRWITNDGTNVWVTNGNVSSVTKIYPSGCIRTYTRPWSSFYAWSYDCDANRLWVSNNCSIICYTKINV